MTPEIKNAKIQSTSLGYEDNGILTCCLMLNYESGGQGFGMYALDAPPIQRKPGFDRRGTAFGMEFIRRILLTVDVERWEQLPGKHIRVEASEEKVHRIGHIIKDIWFDPEDLKEFKTASPGGEG